MSSNRSSSNSSSNRSSSSNRTSSNQSSSSNRSSSNRTSSNQSSQNDSDDYNNEDRHVFYRSIVQETDEMRQKRFRGRNKRLVRTEYVGQIYNAITDLTNDILDEWRDKVKRASEKGYMTTNIYEYQNGDMFRDFPVAFLMKGPKDSDDFFETNGMFSVVEEVQSEICAEGFRVGMKYVGKGKTVIYVDWRAGLFE